MPSQYVIGIDLGTTNSVVAYAPLEEAEAGPETEAGPDVQLLPIPQITAPGTLEEPTVLPSFLYLAGQEEKVDDYRLPWNNSSHEVVGTYARSRSAECPDRTVGAAKSWLTHADVDRHDAILPWESQAEVTKVSPVTATRRYLEHLIAAWNQNFTDAPFEAQQVVVTVPASFDASARELTREAAIAAGFPANFVLIEEPQAAVYAWLHAQAESWRDQLKVGDRLLVCDVGGGTTDLTLVSVMDEAGELGLHRVAVGKHLLVGGDNMDLAIAHQAAELFQSKGVSLDAWQSVSLWHSCRQAKEVLLADDAPSNHKVSVLGRGRRLIGGTVSIKLEREKVRELIVNGFFPNCQRDARPQVARQSGFVQLGLPFETETGITRHIAAFLSDQPGGDDPGGQAPTHVLFNGGVFRSAKLRERLLQQLADWFPDRPPEELEGERDLDFAVARGAAYYGFSKHHGGMRIRGGTARSYYIGIETAGLAIPGAPRPMKALCVVPYGMEEGTHVDVNVASVQTGLVLGEPVQFRFFSSLTRRDDRPGDLIERIDPDEMSETDSLEATLPAPESGDDRYVPVRFQSRVTELGVFELWCVSTKSDDRWKLEFNVRDKEPSN